MKGWSFAPHTSVAPQWHYAFSRFAEQISDFSPAFQGILEDFKHGEEEQFASEGGYGSGHWKPLSPKYAKWKESVRPGRPILVFDGDLRRAATNPRFHITRSNLQIVIDDSSGSKSAKALYHQTGAGHLPARPVVQLPQSQVVRWRKIFQSYMIYATRGPWGGGRFL